MKQQVVLTIDVKPQRKRTQADRDSSRRSAAKRYETNPKLINLINKRSYYKKCLRFVELEIKELTQ